MPRRLLCGSVLLLLLLAGVAPAAARPLPGAPQTVAVSIWDRLFAWWGAVAKDLAPTTTGPVSPKSDNGSGIDPFGKPASTTQDVGSGIDPFGGK
jgi:hypothetical protein